MPEDLRAIDAQVALLKRTWAYIQRPAAYEMAPCECGNRDPDWSEYEGRLWCPRCEKDFLPAHGGVFDAPIPMEAAHLLGMCFSRVMITTGALERELCCQMNPQGAQDSGVEQGHAAKLKRGD